MKSIGFKEWAAVCDAIRQGRQTVIIRKGGLAEGREGFSFKHRQFYLFPTWFHVEAAKITEPRFSSTPKSSESVMVQCAVTVEWSGLVTEWSTAQALAPFHILREEVVRERFDYKGAGLYVVFVRAFRLDPGWVLPNEKRFEGCRSWIELPGGGEMCSLENVMEDSEFARQRDCFLAIANAVQ